ncbi:MAG: anti-sigma factor antagonist [Lachnospiraceae bacterium]|nr:anti-sigma factor antagonist [Lachnospiraceae bacterium]
MDQVSGGIKDNRVLIHLTGRVDSNNAKEVESAITELMGDESGMPLEIDAENLEYISSAGLRIILHLRKMQENMKITGVNPEVYEIFDMTGFTQMINIEKAYRVVSVEGCEEIGRGANGTIYRIDQDNVVKVYNNADALQEIQHEREVARTALVLGIPTAISYDVVRVGDSYGSVFELLNARSFSKILSTEPDKMEWCVKEYTDLLKKIHSTVVPEGDLPDLRETVISWARFLKDYLPEDMGRKLLSLVRAVPKDDHMIHGDYHTKNVELTDDEVLLIDMDTLAVGNPVFELASMFNAFIGFSECDPEIIKKFQGFDHNVASEFWHRVLAEYLGTDDEDIITAVEDKARIIGYTRLVRRSIRRGGLDTEQGRKEIEHWKSELIELLQRTDSLTFLPLAKEFAAVKSELPAVTEFVERHLEEADCPLKTLMQIDVAVEEIFINIASYAYPPGKGRVTVKVEAEKDPGSCTLTFIDSGKPFDPLDRDDPDVTLSAEDRDIGGLGVLMVKKSMDELDYKYENSCNILRIKKNFERDR